MKKAEREHYAKLAELGCITCLRIFFEQTPAEMHHPRENQGLGQKAPYTEAIPLCMYHHRLADGTAKFFNQIAIHHNQAEFERRYGTEAEQLEHVRRLL